MSSWVSSNRRYSPYGRVNRASFGPSSDRVHLRVEQIDRYKVEIRVSGHDQRGSRYEYTMDYLTASPSLYLRNQSRLREQERAETLNKAKRVVGEFEARLNRFRDDRSRSPEANGWGPEAEQPTPWDNPRPITPIDEEFNRQQWTNAFIAEATANALPNITHDLR